ncbi:MAG: presenilin family intramembrane aspartyl protease [Candidatus Aenigmatarchaeota archaeon]
MKTVFVLILLFLITQFLGLYVGDQYIQAIKSGEAVPALEKPESIESSFLLFGYILITTIGILILIKFKKSFIRVLEAIVIFIASWFTLDFLIPLEIWYLSLGFFLALILTAWKVLSPNIINQNVLAIISGSGVGALLGASLGIIPSIVFILILSCYDFISVFITKHMVHMAKAITERPTSFTVAMPHKFKKLTYVAIKNAKKKVHVFQLGVGDMVIPLMFSVSVLNKFSLINSLATIAGSTLALFCLIYFLSKKPTPMPALPFITFGTFFGFLISLI